MGNDKRDGCSAASPHLGDVIAKGEEGSAISSCPRERREDEGDSSTT
jgi:hypothetical protein